MQIIVIFTISLKQLMFNHKILNISQKIGQLSIQNTKNTAFIAY
jgi:hypothetical protein